MQYLFACMFVNIIRSDVPAGICMYLLVLEVYVLVYEIQVDLLGTKKHSETILYGLYFCSCLVPSVSFG